MAKGLSGVIRLHKWQVDEKRRQIAELESMREELIQKMERLDQELAREQRQLAESNVVDINYANYANSVMRRKENLESSINEVDVSIEEMKDELADAFKELKKYEIAQERAEEREREKLKHKEQERLDELSLNMFRSGQR
ncbi:flagellar FliJ family protein [Pseudemcibacter aquimaris]|uniref:flagellar FliJ family protein n=1 Tax=Pseudemcibacter aquimaris TaxID=2857064 RepID=UPI002013BA5E|nr:flagellar FliJ family protein [Pseudemcibacter aquimaris]MCC3862215.1 flagellar FliJ family protein [Pseudemcibacter aquimaris]WDU58969.1 flagellar FliJ family protein [Pseudemcibacter aquimaris]